MLKWHGLLTVICDKLVRSAEGEPDLEFWDIIVNRMGGGSGPTYLSGWISTFSVFD
jgi:hypothetical protein